MGHALFLVTVGLNLWVVIQLLCITTQDAVVEAWADHGLYREQTDCSNKPVCTNIVAC